MESFFLPSVKDIIASLQKRFKPGNKISVRLPKTYMPSRTLKSLVQFVILIGGFGRSPYLQKCLVRDFGEESVVLADPSK